MATIVNKTSGLEIVFAGATTYIKHGNVKLLKRVNSINIYDDSDESGNQRGQAYLSIPFNEVTEPVEANIDDLYNTVRGYIDVSSGGGGGGSSQPFAFTADNYTQLLTLTGMVSGNLAYVTNAEGTAWLPGTIGGSYYPNGIYVYTTEWTSDRNAISLQLALDDVKLDSLNDKVDALEDNDLQNRILVNQSNYLTTLGGVIDSTKEYFIDGIIDMGTTSITVPVTGLSLNGYNFEVSKLFSTEDNYTMFVSETPAIGSGNFIGQDYDILVNGANSKVYELYDATGFNAFEFSRVNYTNCTSLGDIHDYRQGLENGTGRFGGSPSLTLHGNWLGGYRITTSITRSMSDTTTEALFKAGTAFVMNSRFLTDMNVDLGTLQPFIDFAPVNFPNPSSLELVDCLITRDGVVNPQDTNISPNISASDLSSSWVGNNGITNTFVGGECVITTEVTTVISTQNVAVPVLGTQGTIDLQHFDSPVNGQLRFLGTKPVEYTVSWDFVLEGQQNGEYRIDLCRVRQGVKTVVHSQIRVINNLQGGRDVAYYTGSHHEILFQTDYTFWEVANITGSQDCTLELDSSWIIDAR